MSTLTVSNLSAGYYNRKVLDNINLTINPKGITGLLGANGCGKTTLIKALCGIIPHTGKIVLDDILISDMSTSSIARHISYVPQKSGITIDISVMDVVLMGFNPKLGLLSAPTRAMRDLSAAVIEQVGLADLRDRNFLKLSEGQKQLCILARAFAGDNSCMLLDEPESALDIPHRHRIMKLLSDWCLDADRTAVCVLHDPSLALNYCRDLVLLKDKGVSDIIHPFADDLQHMEDALSKIYGNITLTECPDKKGRRHLVMLKEYDDETYS